MADLQAYLVITLLTWAAVSVSGTPPALSTTTGDTVNIPCLFGEGTLRYILWYYNDRTGPQKILILAKGVLTIAAEYANRASMQNDNSTLILKEITAADEGTYHCVVNRHGQTAVSLFETRLIVFCFRPDMLPLSAPTWTVNTAILVEALIIPLAKVLCVVIALAIIIPAIITLATFTVFLYHWKTRDSEVDSYVSRSSDWWVFAFYSYKYVGKRVLCTPYVRPPVQKEFPQTVLLVIHDDLRDDIKQTREEMKEYRKLYPSQQMFVEWGCGDINIRLSDLTNEDTISERTLCIMDINLDRKVFSFVVKPLESGASHKLLTFTLDQKGSFSYPILIDVHLSYDDSTSLERIPASTDGDPCSHIRTKDLAFYVNRSSDWWIVKLITNYFVGKRVICTPYVQPPVKKEFPHTVLLVIHDGQSDDIEQTSEEMKEFRQVYPPRPMLIEWRYGDINIRLFDGPNDNEEKIDEVIVGKRDIVAGKKLFFEVKPLESGESHKVLKFALEQNESPSDPTLFRFIIPYDGSPRRATATAPAPLEEAMTTTKEANYPMDARTMATFGLGEQVDEPNMALQNSGLGHAAEVIPHEHGSSATGNFGAFGGELSTKSHGFTLHIPPGALEEDVKISLKVLTDIPKGLTLKEDEVLVSHGFQCYPSGLRFKKPAKLIIPHCAIVTAPNKVQTVLYSWNQEGTPKRLPDSSDIICSVQERWLEVSVSHFSGGFFALIWDWIFLRGILLSCMSFLPRVLDTSRETLLEVCFAKKHHGQKWTDVHELNDPDVQPVKRDDDEFVLRNETLTVTCQLGKKSPKSDVQNIQNSDLSGQTKVTKYFELDFARESDKTLVTLEVVQTSTPGSTQPIKFFTRFQATCPSTAAMSATNCTCRREVTDEDISNLSRLLPEGKYGRLGGVLGFPYTYLDKILKKRLNDTTAAFEEVLHDWKNKGRSMEDLDAALRKADLGALIPKYKK